MRQLSQHESLAIQRHRDLLEKMGIRQPKIYVIGSHDGATAVGYLDAIPTAEVWAFEPVFRRASLSAPLSGPRCHEHELALGEHSGALEVWIRRDLSVSSALEVDPRLEARSDNYRKIELIEVEMSSIDDLMSLHDEFSVPDLLSIDTQGFDLRVLRGAENLLRSEPPSVVSCELYFGTAYVDQPRPFEIFEYLENRGYRFHGFTRMVEASSGALYFGTGLFVAQAAWKQLGYL